jgi:DNA-binding MarR family transcriptional regulator
MSISFVQDALAQDGANGAGAEAAEDMVTWLERALPRIMRRLIDTENLDMPLLQLPIAQLRLAQALYQDAENDDIQRTGQTMGRLSERLSVRHNALSQAADRLVNHELAERISDVTDRRIVRLRLTEKGREWVGARRARRRAHLVKLWNALDSEERVEFVQAARVLEAAGDRLARRTSTEDEPDGPQSVVKDSEKKDSEDLFTVEETLSRFRAD